MEEPIAVYQLVKLFAQPVTAFMIGYVLAVIAHV